MHIPVMHSFAFIGLLVLGMVARASAAAASGGPTGPTQGTTYAQLAPVRGQWSIAAAVSRDGGAFEPLPACNATSVNDACLQPLLSSEDRDVLQVNFSLKAEPIATVNNMQPTGLIFRACYASMSTTDRPWRKPSPVIDLDKSCPYVIGTSAFNATSYQVNWTLPANTTTAVLYPAVFVQCQNGTQISFCQTDSTVNSTYFGTEIINQTPTSLIAATAVCAALGPVFLAFMFIKDAISRKRQ